MYARVPAVDDVKITSAKQARLEVSATIYEGDEDERQIPLTADFYLLPHSIVDLLKARRFQLAQETDASVSPTDEAYLEALAESFSGTDEESALLSSLITDLIDENKAATIRVGNLGNGKSSKITSGTYYLFGYARSGDELFVWNLPVVLLPGNNRIEIDQYNADAVIYIYQPNFGSIRQARK